MGVDRWHPTCATSHAADEVLYEIGDNDILSMSAVDRPQAGPGSSPFPREGRAPQTEIDRMVQKAEHCAGLVQQGQD